MEVIKLAALESMPNKMGLDLKMAFDSADCQVKYLSLQPGQQAPVHPSPVDVLFYAVSGKGKIMVGEETSLVDATDMVYCPKNVNHGIVASEGEVFSVFVIQTPRGK